ncbi:MAG: ARMT1-like domain-containing protein [Candidatus Nezhaarchaeota archaeon]|nr:ARMT1-like domain-containing protein [Candidatus Nezhaarchaeota archaeon]
MKLKPSCIPCIIDVRLKELVRLGVTEEEGLRVLIEVVDTISRLAKPGLNVAKLASAVYRKFKEMLKRDPYLDIKKRALDAFNEVREACHGMLWGLEGYERFAMAVKLALAGNSFDYGVSGFAPPKLEDIPKLVDEMVVERDETLKLYELSKGSSISYLLDNVEELPFDLVFINEMKKLGGRVTAIVKSAPFQNDVTTYEAMKVGLGNVADKIIETGVDASSVFLEEASNDARIALMASNIIVAKGMAHFEYLAETPLKNKTFFLLQAKCEPVAQELGVARKSYVVLWGSSM